MSDKRYSGDNKLILPKSSHRQQGLGAAAAAQGEAQRKVEEQKAKEKQAEQEKAAKAAKSAFTASIPTTEPKTDYLWVPLYAGAVYQRALSDAFHAQGQAQL